MKKALTAAVLLAGLAASGPLSASPTCTKAPQQKWLSEDAMKKKIADLGYKEIKVFKTTEVRPRSGQQCDPRSHTGRVNRRGRSCVSQID